MRNWNTRKTNLSIVAIAAGLVLAACVPYDGTLDTVDPILANEVLLTGTPGGSCPTPPSTLSPEGRFLKASYSDAACARLRVCLSPDAWKDLNPSTYIPGIDIVILFDVTGSMTPYINAMISNIEQLMDNLSELSSSVRIGLASYRDFADRGGSYGDKPYMMNVPLTSTVSEVKGVLSNFRASGGGDLPESLSTAVRAAIDGKGMGKYFGESNLGWQEDPARIKIVLGVTDAADKKTGLPTGAASLQEAAELLKSKGVLFLGIGRKVTSSKSQSDLTSYNDLAFLARFTNAVAATPGVDLDGDDKTDTYGEVKTGDPAVLLMTADGQVEGAPKASNPTRVLADAITQMVKRVRPYQFSLSVNGNGRPISGETGVLAVPANATGEACFSGISLARKPVPAGSCAGASEVAISSDEETNGSFVDATFLRAEIEIDLGCITGPAPAPSSTPSPQPSPDPAPCHGVGCAGGVIGV